MGRVAVQSRIDVVGELDGLGNIDEALVPSEVRVNRTDHKVDSPGLPHRPVSGDRREVERRRWNEKRIERARRRQSRYPRREGYAILEMKADGRPIEPAGADHFRRPGR